MRFFQAVQDLAADALVRFARFNAFHLEEPFRIMLPVFVSQPIAALGDDAHAAPLAIANFEHVVDQARDRAFPSRRTARAY